MLRRSTDGGLSWGPVITVYEGVTPPCDGCEVSWPDVSRERWERAKRPPVKMKGVYCECPPHLGASQPIHSPLEADG